MNTFTVFLIRMLEVFLVAELGYVFDSYALTIVGGAVLGLIWAANDRESEKTTDEKNS